MKPLSKIREQMRGEKDDYPFITITYQNEVKKNDKEEKENKESKENKEPTMTIPDYARKFNVQTEMCMDKRGLLDVLKVHAVKLKDKDHDFSISIAGRGVEQEFTDVKELCEFITQVPSLTLSQKSLLLHPPEEKKDGKEKKELEETKLQVETNKSKLKP